MSLPYAGFGGFRYSAVTNAAGAIISKTLDGFAVFDRGDAVIDRHTILHEIGHALTLKHTSAHSSDGSNAPAPYLPAALDNSKYTVMSYRANPDTGAFSNHLMIYDIAALQARFGANLHFHTGNDTYTGPHGNIQVIWDAGGNDRLDGSACARAVQIDLRQGAFSSLGAHDNLAIAYRVIIENASGGSAGDVLVGNQWNNALSGRGGDDTLNGLAGNDVLNGGRGADRLIGSAGCDAFVFADTIGPGEIDRIADFSPVADVIRLKQAIFGALASLGGLAANAFHVGAVAEDASQRIIYDSATGALFYDQDGDRSIAPVQFASLNAGLALTHEDFWIF